MKAKLSSAIKEVINNLKYPETPIVIQLPKIASHGDFSTNLAMQLASTLNENPKKIAETISKKLMEDFPELIQKAKVAGPGFINIDVNKSYITSQLHTILKSKTDFGKSNDFKGKKALVEFVSANPTGPLTVGHGRGAMLGDVISNILHWNGYDVEREYYYNNAGKQMERLGLSVQSRYLQILGESTIFPKEGYEGEYIIEIAQALNEKDGDIHKNTTDLSVFIKAAENQIFKEIKNTLSLLKLNFNNYFNEQSLYDSGAIKGIINKLKKKKLIYEKDGATWFKATKAGREQDRVIIKSSGEPTYRLPDIAYHQNKIKRGYDIIIDILGADHMDAYPDVLAAIEQMGHDTKNIKVLIHQFVTLTKNGEPVKMSTRKAQYVTLDELIKEVGIDVTRYFFLMRGMNSHLNFDIELAKDESDENPVFYLQYAHARLCNILKHAESLKHDIDLDTDLSFLSNDSEINIIKTIMEFPLIIKNSSNSLEPQLITNYLYDLASKFHKYYAHERIVTNNKQITAARLVLIKCIKIVLNNGLTILGINAPEKM
tara:strand:- start:35 stop:1666 length:1632 start_codon:yes stop_codon:yes gene_type:complete